MVMVGAGDIAGNSTSVLLLLQDMELGAPDQYYFYPALSIDGMGNLDVVYGYSSSTIYPSLAVTGQAAAGSGGALAPPQVLVQELLQTLAAASLHPSAGTVTTSALRSTLSVPH